MNKHKKKKPENESSCTELGWLVRLRWLAAIGQLLLIAMGSRLLSLDLPLLPLTCAVAVLVVSNVGLMWCERRNVHLKSSVVGAVLILDTLLLAVLLYWTGGPFNPFSVFFLVHIAVAAIALGRAWTWTLALVSSICFSLLFRFHRALDGLDHHGAMVEGSLSLHLYGMLLAFVATAGLLAYFLCKLVSELRSKEAAMREFERQSLVHERLASLTTLSAGAAHELSSPLSTIAVAAKELANGSRELGPRAHDLLDDAELISQGVLRCRRILDRMGGRSGQLKGEVPSELSLQELVDELREECISSVRGCSRESFRISMSHPDVRIVVPRTGLLQTLQALVKNAFDAAANGGAVELFVDTSEGRAIFRVSDSGMGMSEEVQQRLGEPFFSTKQPGEGMGLGLFLAKLFAKRWGGTLHIQSELRKGSEVELVLPKLTTELKVVANG